MSRNRKTSIEEVISHRLVWVGLVVLVLTALLTILLFRSGYNRQVKEDMSITARVLAASLEEGCAPEELASVEEVRLTLIDPDGTVLYDSASSGEENHLSRPEVQQAIETGEGFVQRQSDITLLTMPWLWKTEISSGWLIRPPAPMPSMTAAFLP